MTDKQKRFLTALDDLLRMYNIDIVTAGGEYIKFESNDEELKFVLYENGEYQHISDVTKKYRPRIGTNDPLKYKLNTE